MTAAKSTSTVIIFCDGACSGNPGPGGWSFIARSGDSQTVTEAAGHAPQSTNNRMEMQAALEALKYLEKHPPLRATIYGDSKYVIQGLESWIHGWKKRGWTKADGQKVLNEDLWQALDIQKSKLSHIKIDWEYVPGHSGVLGNERVDTLAVQASQDSGFALYENFAWAKYPRQEIFALDNLTRESAKSPKTSSKSSSAKALGYLSVLDGKLQEHQSWSECEARVKGKSGARFKKYTSPQERKSILKAWNLED